MWYAFRHWLILASYFLTKADRAGCWLGNTLLATSSCYFTDLKSLLAQGVMDGQPFPFSILTKICKRAGILHLCAWNYLKNKQKENSLTFRKIKLQFQPVFYRVSSSREYYLLADFSTPIKPLEWYLGSSLTPRFLFPSHQLRFI